MDSCSWDDDTTPMTTSTVGIPKQYQSQDIDSTASTTSSVDSAKVRAWARAQGMDVGKRGRLNKELIATYVKAHP